MRKKILVGLLMAIITIANFGSVIRAEEYIDNYTKFWEPTEYFLNFQPYMDAHAQGKVQFLTSVDQAVPLAKIGEGFKVIGSYASAKDDYPFKTEVMDKELDRLRSCGSRTGYRTDQDLVLWRLFQNNIFDPDLSANLDLGGEIDTGKKGWDFMRVAVNAYDVNKIPAKKAVAWEGNQAGSRLFWVADVTNNGKTVILETFINKQYTLIEAPAKNFYYIHIASVKKPFSLALPGSRISPRFGSVGGSLVRTFTYGGGTGFIVGFKRPVSILDLRKMYSQFAYLQEFPPRHPYGGGGENATAFLAGVPNDQEATLRDLLVMIDAYWKKTGFIKVLGQPATFDGYFGPKVVNYADKEQVINDPEIGTVAKGLEMYGLLDYLLTTNSNGNKALIPDRKITRGQIGKFLRVFIGRNGYTNFYLVFKDEDYNDYQQNKDKLDTAQSVLFTGSYNRIAQDLYRDIFASYSELSQFKKKYQIIYGLGKEGKKPEVRKIYY